MPSGYMAGDFLIRDYRDSDFENIQALWLPLGLGSSQRGDTAEVIIRTLSAGGKFLVLEEKSSGKLVGTSWMTVDGRRNYLHHFGIDETYQQCGLGRMLLDASLAIAREMGLQLKIEVHRQNERALNLYTRNGFKYLGDYDVYIIRDI
jgi:[ribosomal protein S18]-alanine N-acetyltransferase